MRATDRSTIFAVLAPPVAWFASLAAVYGLVHHACLSMTTVLLHGVCAVGLVAAGSGGVVGWMSWRRRGDVEGANLLAAVGALAGALFALVIIVQWVAVLLVSPCEPAPRERQAPVATHARVDEARPDH